MSGHEHDLFSDVRRRLAHITDVSSPPVGTDAIAYTAWESDPDMDETEEASAAFLEEVRTALGPRYHADWTGNGNGNESDIAIYRAPSAC